jgi:hypothetical protein
MPEDERRWWLRPTGRRNAVRLFVLVFVGLSSMLVGLSPLALDAFGGSATSWARRGNIGATYGAAAALLSVLALAGVAVSLVLQARETMVTREQTARAVHTELLKTTPPTLNAGARTVRRRTTRSSGSISTST